MAASSRVGLGAVLGMLFTGAAVAGPAADFAQPPCQWVAQAGLDPSLAPDPARLDASPTRHRQLPLYRELMRRPLAAPCRANGLLEQARHRFHSPQSLFRWAAGMAGIETARLRGTACAGPCRGRADADPLAEALAWMSPAAQDAGLPWPPPLPDRDTLPDPLRTEVAGMLAAIGVAHGLLQRALAALPATLTVQALQGRLMQGGAAPPTDEATDLPALLPLLDREALVAGMLDLVTAALHLHGFVASAPGLPPVSWRLDTPFGVIVVDTSGRSSVHRLAQPLLLLDVGGDDRYEFDAAGAARRIAVVIDHGGNDRYVAHADGADPSAATLGYGILWDGDGDDVYEGGHFAQAAALFGAALLVDSAGANRFVAAGHAQSYAFGGIALLASSPGNDEFSAQTHAQASAGPEAVAVLIDPGGHDRYTLHSTPLSRPSPQLPSQNTSMGQGAGRGLRGTDGRSATGGIGMLIDFAGDDRYSASVFAQGAGFHEGLGMLIDAGGSDRFDAAWYAMGAAAHTAAGVLLKRGSGNDRYRATHSTSLGAAHDLSVALFVDEGGDDEYALGDLGLGAAHDDGVAAFVDLAGRDRYAVSSAACRAFGVVARSGPALTETDPRAVGLFIDPDGEPAEVAAICPRASLGRAHTRSDMPAR